MNVKNQHKSTFHYTVLHYLHGIRTRFFRFDLCTILVFVRLYYSFVYAIYIVKKILIYDSFI